MITNDKKFSSISVYGGGGWGTALACQIARNYETVPLFLRSKEIAEEIDTHHINSKYLGPDIKLSPNIKPTNDIAGLLDQEVIVIAVPSYALKNTLHNLKIAGLKEDTILLIATKGLIPFPTRLFSEEIKTLLPNPFAFISGPNFAREVALDLLTPATIACQNLEIANKLAISIASANFIITTTSDIITIQIAGAVKNIIAIQSGIYEALGHKENAKAGLITEGFKEIFILSQHFGGKFETTMESAVLGDLLLTCYSKTSRNTKFGYEFALSKNKADFLKNYPFLVEGAESAKLILEWIELYHLDLPVISSVAKELSL